MDFFLKRQLFTKNGPISSILIQISHFKKFFYFIFDVFLESNNKSTNKNFLVDPDPTKVGTLKGSEGPKVIFLNFLSLWILKIHQKLFSLRNHNLHTKRKSLLSCYEIYSFKNYLEWVSCKKIKKLLFYIP